MIVAIQKGCIKITFIPTLRKRLQVSSVTRVHHATDTDYMQPFVAVADPYQAFG